MTTLEYGLTLVWSFVFLCRKAVAQKSDLLSNPYVGPPLCEFFLFFQCFDIRDGFFQKLCGDRIGNLGRRCGCCMHQREFPVIPCVRPLAHDRHDLLFFCSIMGRMWIAADLMSAFRRVPRSDQPIAVTKEICDGCDMARPFRHF